MIKEAKKIDFLTTGRQPSEKEFARISEWIERDKQKRAASKTSIRKTLERTIVKNTSPNKGMMQARLTNID